MPENPYPEYVFPAYDKEDMGRIADLLSDGGYSMTRLHGSWGRHVWDYATRDALRAVLKAFDEATESMTNDQITEDLIAFRHLFVEGGRFEVKEEGE